MLLSKYLWPTTVRCLRSSLWPPRSMSYLPLIALQMIPSSHPMSWSLAKVVSCHLRVYLSLENLKSFFRSRSLPTVIIQISKSVIISCSKQIIILVVKWFIVIENIFIDVCVLWTLVQHGVSCSPTFWTEDYLFVPTDLKFASHMIINLIS